MAYRNQMTGELGYTKQECYDQRMIFKDQVILRFGPTHEDVKALQELYQIRYQGDIDEFLQQIESMNNLAKVTGIAFRIIVEDETPEEAVRQMSMQQEYIDDREWLEALHKAVKDEEDPLEQQKLKGNPFGTAAQKRIDPEPAAVAAKKPKYTAKEKRLYQAAKKRRPRQKRKQQGHGKRSYSEYGKWHTRELTRRKLMNAKEKVNAYGVHSATMDGNTARKKFALVQPD